VTGPGFESPEGLRRAVTDRLRALASREPGTQLSDLLRQFAYDRLLCRLFTGSERGRWVLKGATALLARLGPTARHTVDVDLFDEAGSLDDAEQALRVAATLDLGDFFRFTLSPGRPASQGGIARRVSVTAYLGATRFAEFHVDLVAGLRMTGIPDEVDPLIPLELPGIVRVTYRAYPVEDHVADKLCALLEVHARSVGPPQPSTRYRDLADLATLARTVTMNAERLAVALRSEASRRGLALPNRMTAPTGSSWPSGYTRVARGLPAVVDRTVDAAANTVARLLDPVLAGKARGAWDPHALQWG